MASAHRARTWAGVSRRRRMASRLAPSKLATRVRSLASSWAVVRRPVGETPASASPRRLDLRVKTRSNSARRASATSPAGGGLWVVLGREGGHVQALHALHDPVVGVDVGHPGAGRKAVAVDREPVV